MDGVADLIPMSEPCHRDEVCRRLSGRLHDRPHALERSSVEDIANAEHRGEHDRQERRKQQVMPTRPDEYRIGHEAVGFVGATISVPTIPAVNPMLYRPHVRLEEMRGRRREDESDQEAGRQGAFTGGALAKLAVKARFGYGLAASLANASASGTALLMLVFLTPLMGADSPDEQATAPTSIVRLWPAIALGAVFLPWLLYPAIGDLTDAVTFGKVWDGLWPIIIGAALAVALRRWGANFPRIPRRTGPRRGLSALPASGAGTIARARPRGWPERSQEPIRGSREPSPRQAVPALAPSPLAPMSADPRQTAHDPPGNSVSQVMTSRKPADGFT